MTQKTAWLVESIKDGNGDGYWTMPRRGMGGWHTNDANEARHYTEAEARAVAEALSYFPTPFRWSQWRATEHVFLAVDEPMIEAMRREADTQFGPLHPLLSEDSDVGR